MKKAQVKQPKSWWRDGAIVVAIIASLTNISTVMLSAHYTEKSQKHLDRINEAAEINRGQLEKQAQQNVIIAQNMEMMKLDLQRSGDKLRQSNDEARLKMESQASILREAEAKREIAQLVNTVRPRIAQKCDLERLSEGQGRLNCRLENQGQFLVHISTKSLQLLGKDGETVIPSGIRPVGPLPGAARHRWWKRLFIYIRHRARYEGAYTSTHVGSCE